MLKHMEDAMIEVYVDGSQQTAVEVASKVNTTNTEKQSHELDNGPDTMDTLDGPHDMEDQDEPPVENLVRVGV